MSSTRHAMTLDAAENANERHLSDPRITGINVGLLAIGRTAPTRTTDQLRAAVWLFNYARLRQRTADALADDLDMSRHEIRDALTKPDCEHLDRFVAIVSELRAHFEANLPELHETTVTKRVRRGVREAAEDGVLSLVFGPYRIGKTAPFKREFLARYMDRAIYIDCPPGNDMRGFTSAIARAMGVSTNSGKKNDHIREQIANTAASGVIDLIFIDEGQYLWPRKVELFPEKIQFLRHLWDAADFQRAANPDAHGLGFAVCATPQFASDLEAAIEGPWAAGQVEGRLRRTYTGDTLTTEEIEGIARSQAPEFSTASIAKLVAVTRASAGLLGFLTNVIGKARFIARVEERSITADLVKEAAQEMLAGTAIEKRAKETSSPALAS